MALNLVQHRVDTNVWDQVDRREWDTERWLAAFAAGALATAEKPLAWVRLDPEAQAQYLLGAAYAQNGQYQESRQVLTSIRQYDPQYARAQKLLATLAQSGH